MEGNKNKLRIAVMGCLHGSLKDIYEEIQQNEIETGKNVDFLICCGDFQVTIFNLGIER